MNARQAFNAGKRNAQLTELSTCHKDVATVDAVHLAANRALDVALDGLLDIRIVDEDDARESSAQGTFFNHGTATPNLIHLAGGRCVGEDFKGQGVPGNTVAHQLLHESKIQKAAGHDMPGTHGLLAIEHGQDAGVPHDYHAAPHEDLLLNFVNGARHKVNDTTRFVL